MLRRRVGEQTGVEAAGGVGEPEERFVGEREERAAEDAGEADFVGGAGDGAEQVEDVEDFLLGVERVAADEVVVEAVFAEGFFVDLDVAERAEEDGDVAGLSRRGFFVSLSTTGSSVQVGSSNALRRRAIALASSRRALSFSPA